MALSKDVILARMSPEKIVLENREFAKWLAKRHKVSAKALGTAIHLLSKGMIEAMIEGYSIRLWGVGTFEPREMQPRNRYHRIKQEVYMSPANTVVHFKKSENLNLKVREGSKARLEKALSEPSVRKAVRK